MSQLLKLIRNAGRTTGRPTAGFAARAQETARKKLVLIASVDKIDVNQVKAAVAAGADAVEVPLDASHPAADQLQKVTSAVDAPVGAAVAGGVPTSFDVKQLEGKGLDFLKVEAGDVPATIFLAEDLAVVLELKESFSDTMLKMLNFLPAKAIQVDSPDTVEGFTIKQLMEKRVDRELIGKPLLMKVGASIKPEAAQLLALIAPNALVIPAAEVAAWKEAVENLKEIEPEEQEGGPISLKVPVSIAPA